MYFIFGFTFSVDTVYDRHPLLAYFRLIFNINTGRVVLSKYCVYETFKAVFNYTSQKF